MKQYGFWDGIVIGGAIMTTTTICLGQIMVWLVLTVT